MNIYQTKLGVEYSKEILLQTILRNRKNLDTNLIVEAIKDFIKNHERHSDEKKNC